jgi:hypothetical protein
MHENREISAVPVKDVVWWVGQGRPVAYNPDKYAAEKSDIGILPVRVPNKVGEANCGGAGGKVRWPRGILERTSVTCTQIQGEALNGLDRIRRAAKRFCVTHPR